MLVIYHVVANVEKIDAQSFVFVLRYKVCFEFLISLHLHVKFLLSHYFGWLDVYHLMLL